MDQQEVMGKVVEILRPFVKNPTALTAISMDTSILKDLKVNSARLVDIILEMESEFDIELGDDEADRVRTIGDAVSIIDSKTKA